MPRWARYAYVGATALVLAVALGVWRPSPEEVDAKAKGNASPRFEVDPFWPKPFPNKWQIGQVGGIAVDSRDHIWILQRQRTLTEDEAGAEQDPPRSDCCRYAPTVMEFDSRGNFIQGWGGPFDPGFLETRCVEPECQWPGGEHGIFVDHNDFVWIAGNGNTPNPEDPEESIGDHMVLKFTRRGDFVMQIGARGMTGGSNATNGGPNGTPLLGRPADVEVDPVTNEAYIADGYQNKRVLVVDASTGLYKRHWGAYGNTPSDDDLGDYDPNAPVAQQFRNPVHCVRIADDGLVYVCDRVNNRIQVFRKDGDFVTEFFVERDTLGNGSTWDVDLSPDRRQTFLYNPDGENNYVWILERLTGDILSKFGRNGRYAGQFHWVHNLAVDSKGNIYTAEVDTGKRTQKFVPKGNTGRRD